MKKKKDSLANDAYMLGGTTVGLTVMGSVGEKMGGNVAGIQSFSSMLPAVGIAVGGKAVLKELKKMKK